LRMCDGKSGKRTFFFFQKVHQAFLQTLLKECGIEGRTKFQDIGSSVRKSSFNDSAVKRFDHAIIATLSQKTDAFCGRLRLMRQFFQSIGYGGLMIPERRILQ